MELIHRINEKYSIWANERNQYFVQTKDNDIKYVAELSGDVKLAMKALIWEIQYGSLKKSHTN